MADRTEDATEFEDPVVEQLEVSIRQLREKLAQEFARGTLTDGEKQEALRVLYEAGKLAGLLDSLTPAVEADHAG